MITLSKLLTKLKNSKLFKNTSTYLLFNVLERSVPFLILPILTRELTPYDIGIYSTFQAIVVFFMPIIGLGSDSSILRNYYGTKPNIFKQYFFNGILVFVISSIFVFIIFNYFKIELSIFLDFPAKAVYLTLFYCFLQYLNNLHLNMFQVKKKAMSFGFNKLFVTLTKNGFSLIFVFGLLFRWEGLLFGNLISLIIFGTIALISFYRGTYLSGSCNLHYIKRNLQIGTPLVLHGLGSWSNSLAVRLILNSILGAHATGNFSIGTTFGLIISILQDSFNKAYVPFLFEKLEANIKKDSKKIVLFTYFYHISFLIFAFIIGFIGTNYLEFIFGNKFIQAKELIYYSTFAYAFNGMYKMHVNFIFFTKKTSYISIITIISGIVNVLLSFFLIHQNGAVGAVQSLLLCNFLSFILAWLIGNKIIPMPWLLRGNK